MIIVPALRGYRMIANHCSIIMSPLQGFIGCEMPLCYNNTDLSGLRNCSKKRNVLQHHVFRVFIRFMYVSFWYNPEGMT